MTRKTVPLSRVVPVISLALSARPPLSTGKPSVDQIFAIVAPGRNETTSREISSIATVALPSPSCAVTTRRMFTSISSQSLLRSGHNSEVIPPPSYGGGAPEGGGGGRPHRRSPKISDLKFQVRRLGLHMPSPTGGARPNKNES